MSEIAVLVVDVAALLVGVEVLVAIALDHAAGARA